MSPTRWLLALLLLATTVAAAGADELRIPIGSQGHQASRLPSHGVPVDRVRALWGEPARVHAAVGNPPITRWDYPDFSVYFEYHHVVHAVAHHRHSEPDTLPTDP